MMTARTKNLRGTSLLDLQFVRSHAVTFLKWPQNYPFLSYKLMPTHHHFYKIFWFYELKPATPKTPSFTQRTLPTPPVLKDCSWTCSGQCNNCMHNINKKITKMSLIKIHPSHLDTHITKTYKIKKSLCQSYKKATNNDMWEML